MNLAEFLIIKAAVEGCCWRNFLCSVEKYNMSIHSLGDGGSRAYTAVLDAVCDAKIQRL